MAAAKRMGPWRVVLSWRALGGAMDLPHDDLDPEPAVCVWLRVRQLVTSFDTDF
jgi:hypothetical protein